MVLSQFFITDFSNAKIVFPCDLLKLFGDIGIPAFAGFYFDKL